MTDASDTTDSDYTPHTTTIETFGAHIVYAVVESMANTDMDTFLDRLCAPPVEDEHGFDMTLELPVSCDEDITMSFADIRRAGGLAPEQCAAAEQMYRQLRATIYYVVDYNLIATVDTYTTAGMSAFAVFDPELDPDEVAELREIAVARGAALKYVVITVADVFDA